MPNVSISVGGQTAIVPGVYYQDKITPTTATNQSLTGPLVFIAAGYGGVPLAPVNFTSAQDLLNAMRGAPSSDFINFLFNPSSELNGTSLVTYIEVAPNTQSTTTLVSAALPASGVIDLLSVDYGTPSNGMKVTVADGSIAGKAVTITDGFSGQSISRDNLGVPFQLAYANTTAGVTYTIASTIAGKATSLHIASAGSGETVNLDLTSTTFSTVSQVVQFLNGTGTYSAVVLGNGNLPSSYLDVASNVSLPVPIGTFTVSTASWSGGVGTVTTSAPHGYHTGDLVLVSGITPTGYNGLYTIASTPLTTSFTYALVSDPGTYSSGGATQSNPVDQYANVTATLGDIVFFVNTSIPQIAVASIHTGITSAPGLVPADVVNQLFSGATNGVPSLGDYANAFNVALNIPAWIVFADNNSAGVRALGMQHAATASTITYRKWRRYITGSTLGESPTVAETNARQTNEMSTTYVWPGIQQISTVTGTAITYDGLHTAAAVAGMMCGNPVTTPITNKTVLGIGVEQLVSLGTRSNLQNNGVLVLDVPSTTMIPTFLSDVTTWQNDPYPANVFNQQVSERFALAYYMTNALQPYVGTVASNFDIARASNTTKVLLNALIYNGTNSIGILNSWDPNTLVLTYDGTTQTLNVAVSVVFVGEVRFVVVNVAVNPLNIQISPQGVITNG